MRLSMPSAAKPSLGPWWVGIVTACSAAAAAVATVLTVGEMACAPEGVEFTNASTADPKVSLVQAVSLVEHQLNGKAMQAGLRRRDLGWVYLVRVVANGKLLDSEVDADQGEVGTVSPVSPRNQERD